MRREVLLLMYCGLRCVRASVCLVWRVVQCIRLRALRNLGNSRKQRCVALSGIRLTELGWLARSMTSLVGRRAWCWGWSVARNCKQVVPRSPRSSSCSRSSSGSLSCTCCDDQIKGAQDKDFSYSFSDSLSLPRMHTLTHSHTLTITCTCCYDDSKGIQDQDLLCDCCWVRSTYPI